MTPDQIKQEISNILFGDITSPLGIKIVNLIDQLIQARIAEIPKRHRAGIR